MTIRPGPQAEARSADEGSGEVVGIDRSRYELDELLAISRAMSSQRDIRKLLGLILEKSRQITGADAGSVYVLEPVEEGEGAERGEKRLHFMLSQNDSMKIDFQEFHLPVDGSSIVGRAVLDGRPINVADLGRQADLPVPFQHNRSFDDKTGYRARSMLTVPMLSAENVVIGVIQLINKKRRPDRPLLAPGDFEAEVVPFDARAEELALALASQAGVCLENAILYKEITNLFEGFVDASVTAIEARDPTTSGHSRRVATLTVALAKKVDGVSEGPLRDVRFTAQDLRQIEYAGVLHDFGKVGVRESVLVKAKKLYDWQRGAIELRFRYIRKALEAEALRAKLDLVTGPAAPAREVVAEALARADGDLAERLAQVDEAWQVVARANEPTVLDGPVLSRLREVARWEYRDVDGQLRPYLEPQEVEALEVGRGSLTSAERAEIESHVTHTLTFLETIPWGRSLRNVPRIAGAHHESMDGRGYPSGLAGTAIPVESRMLTIADIFDALTASDRPYKPAVPTARALDIIGGEVKAGRCDPLLFQVFVEGQIWKSVL
jgi:HD-GYP domain-containing protein (c-di-GMP phosphodiesterase class II)